MIPYRVIFMFGQKKQTLRFKNQMMLDIVISSRQAEIIPGFVVERLLPYQLRRMVGFLFLWITAVRSVYQPI